jgi:hypothetical protein
LAEIGEGADWGRLCHEVGHILISQPSGLKDAIGSATLDEEFYHSDLVDETQATAEKFDMMGWHDFHPLFSGYHLDEELGIFKSENIKLLSWDHGSTIEYEVVAH